GKESTRIQQDRCNQELRAGFFRVQGHSEWDAFGQGVLEPGCRRARGDVHEERARFGAPECKRVLRTEQGEIAVGHITSYGDTSGPCRSSGPRCPCSTWHLRMAASPGFGGRVAWGYACTSSAAWSSQSSSMTSLSGSIGNAKPLFPEHPLRRLSTPGCP